jgi:hypothetical protein
MLQNTVMSLNVAMHPNETSRSTKTVQYSMAARTCLIR